MSAPHVTGAIALLWALWPEITSTEMQRVLYRTASKDQFTGPSTNFRWGHGKLDIGAAYKFLQSQTEMESESMQNIRTCQFQMKLNSNDKSEKTVTVQLDVDDNQLVAIRGLDENGEAVYTVSFRVRKENRGKKGGDECWECLRGSCPPNALVEVSCTGTPPH
jgi:hypothetical protein